MKNTEDIGGLWLKKIVLIYMQFESLKESRGTMGQLQYCRDCYQEFFNAGKKTARTNPGCLMNSKKVNKKKILQSKENHTEFLQHKASKKNIEFNLKSTRRMKKSLLSKK